MSAFFAVAAASRASASATHTPVGRVGDPSESRIIHFFIPWDQDNNEVASESPAEISAFDDAEICSNHCNAPE